MDIAQKVIKTILRHRLINPGDKILIGVSGGADSVALLYLLNTLRLSLSIQLQVIHVNHHLRNEADKDEKFVKAMCNSLNLPLTISHLKLHAKMKQGGSIEEIAREERFKAFVNTAQKIGTDSIALAHHKDDLAETILMRILRGTGLQGLQAILPKRKINGHIFIRPLLDLRRVEIEDYLRSQKIKFRKDETNKKIVFFRNKIRLKLLPLLEKDYQNNISQSLCNLAVTAGEDYNYIYQQALRIFPNLAHGKSEIKINLKKFNALNPSLGRMLLRIALEKIKGDTRILTLAHFLEIEDLISNQPEGSVTHLPNGIRVTKKNNSLLISINLHLSRSSGIKPRL